MVVTQINIFFCLLGIMEVPCIAFAFLHGVWSGKLLPRPHCRLPSSKIRETETVKQMIFVGLALAIVIHDATDLLWHDARLPRLFLYVFEVLSFFLGAWVGKLIGHADGPHPDRSSLHVVRLLGNDAIALFLVRLVLYGIVRIVVTTY